MSEIKDPKIKLFGKTIQVPDHSAAAAEAGESVSGQSGEAAGEDSLNQDPSCTSDSSMFEDSNNLNRDAEEQQSRESRTIPPKQEDHAKEESKDSVHTQPIITEDPNDPSAERDQTDNSQQDKTTLKKPDKIIPCPRCNSMETKFCYFNNYNVNQPRHFCKNCQRYWTAGGTMRNVPVGAGRRKNKNTVPQFRHLIVPENGGHHPPSLTNPNNATLLTFGSHDSSTPLCESMSSVLNISKNGSSHKPEQQQQQQQQENDENGSCKTGLQNYHPFPVGPPMPYPWSPVQWAANHVPPPGMRFPVPFYPPPYWACPPWSVPWVVPHPGCGPVSPTLGKHSRDEKLPEGSEKSLWFPKTLRIDDPGEAAKSSIWATLGIKNDGVHDSVVGGGLFKAFVNGSKGGEKTGNVTEQSAVLQANPAAFSRSVNFHESS